MTLTATESVPLRNVIAILNNVRLSLLLIMLTQLPRVAITAKNLKAKCLGFWRHYLMSQFFHVQSFRSWIQVIFLFPRLRFPSIFPCISACNNAYLSRPSNYMRKITDFSFFNYINNELFFFAPIRCRTSLLRIRVGFE